LSIKLLIDKNHYHIVLGIHSSIKSVSLANKVACIKATLFVVILYYFDEIFTCCGSSFSKYHNTVTTYYIKSTI